MGKPRTVAQSEHFPSLPNGIKRVSRRRIETELDKRFASGADKPVDEVRSRLYMYWEKNYGKNTVLLSTCGIEVFQDAFKWNDMELLILQILTCLSTKMACFVWLYARSVSSTVFTFPEKLGSITVVFLSKLTTSFECSNPESIEKSGFNRRPAFLTPWIRWHYVMLTVPNSNSCFGCSGSKTRPRASTIYAIKI